MIRPYKQSDLDRIKELHRKQGEQYLFPNLNDPVFAIGQVAEDGTAAFVKIVGEAYLFLDPEQGTPRQRWQSLLGIHEAVRREAAELGLSEVGCYIPPNLGKAFHRRLTKLGWQMEPSDWQRAAYHLRSVTTKARA